MMKPLRGVDLIDPFDFAHLGPIIAGLPETARVNLGGCLQKNRFGVALFIDYWIANKHFTFCGDLLQLLVWVIAEFSKRAAVTISKVI